MFYVIVDGVGKVFIMVVILMMLLLLNGVFDNLLMDIVCIVGVFLKIKIN